MYVLYRNTSTVDKTTKTHYINQNISFYNPHEVPKNHIRKSKLGLKKKQQQIFAVKLKMSQNVFDHYLPTIINERVDLRKILISRCYSFF